MVDMNSCNCYEDYTFTELFFPNTSVYVSYIGMRRIKKNKICGKLLRIVKDVSLSLEIVVIKNEVKGFSCHYSSRL